MRDISLPTKLPIYIDGLHCVHIWVPHTSCLKTSWKLMPCKPGPSIQPASRVSSSAASKTFNGCCCCLFKYSRPSRLVQFPTWQPQIFSKNNLVPQHVIWRGNVTPNSMTEGNISHSPISQPARAVTLILYPLLINNILLLSSVIFNADPSLFGGVRTYESALSWVWKPIHVSLWAPCH